MRWDTIDDLYDVIDRYKNVLTKVIVREEDFVFANDVCNAVTCPVVTLGIEAICDTGEVNFLPYDPYEED